MVIDLATYRRKQAQPRWIAADEQQELICVNWEPARIISVPRVAPVAPLASPQLPGDGAHDEDLAAFHALATALASQI